MPRNKNNNNKVGCELCDAPANMYCESDRASLCWRCDNKVHGANFLVAKHNRCVLCHNCQEVTPWTASGPRLPPSMSLCLNCVSSQHTNANNNNNNNSRQNNIAQNEDEDEDEDEDGDEDGESSFYEEGGYCSEDEEEGENQVVPLTLSNGEMPLSMEISGCISSSTSSDETEGNLTALNNNNNNNPVVSLKRNRGIFLSD